jgi:hypothetical protein
MPRRILAVALAAVIVAAPLAAQKTHTIGEHGAKVVLPGGWLRKRHTDGYGDFQFVVDSKRGWFDERKTVWLVVREHVGPLEPDGDLLAVSSRLDHLPEATTMHVAEEPDWRRATRVGSLGASEGNGVYRSELLVADGLAWHVYAWAAHGDEKLLGDKVEQFLDGFELPGADSEWHRGLRPQRETIERSSTTVSFEVRPFVLRRADDKGTLRRYRTADDRQGLQVWETPAASPADAADGEVRTMTSAYADYRETGRRARTIDGVACLEQTAVTAHYTYRVLIVPVGARRVLQLRYFAHLPADATRRDRDLLFDSVRVTTIAVDAGLPELPPAPRPLPESAALGAFLAEATLVHESAGFASRWARGPDGGWAAATSQGVIAFLADGSMRPVVPDVQYAGTVLSWQGQWWAGGHGGGLQRARADGESASAATVAGTAFATAGNDLVCVRTRTPAWLGSPVPPSGIEPAELLVRAPAGDERAVPFAVTGWITALAADRSTALLAVRAVAPGPGHAARLFAVELADGAQRECGAWDAIDAVAAANGGWLVTGAPVGRPHGVWLAHADGSAELLVGGTELTAVLGADDRLFLTHANGASRLWSVTLAHCRSAGARLALPTAAQLDALGAELLAGAAPGTRAELDATLARVQQLARQRLGAELPEDAGAVRALLGVAARASGRDVGAGCRVVLALSVARASLALGGEWVDGAGTTWHDWLIARDPPRDTPFAWALHPGELVVQTLDGHGNGFPGDLRKRGAGRTLLVGADGMALARAVEASAPAAFTDALANGDVAALAAVLAACPANEHARASAYARFAADGRWPQLVQLADPFATGANAAAADALAVAHGSSELATAADGDGLLRALLAAVHRHPRETGLYLLLGRARERFEPQQPRRARACYDRVIELGSYETAAAEARAALRRLDAK